MNMEAVLPLNFYCRNARLCLKKAAFSKKSQLYADELRHLRKFDALISSTIPCHPLYEERKGDKQIVELQDFLPETSKRIGELEAEAMACKSQSRSKSRSHKPEKGSAKAFVKSPNLSSENASKVQKKARPASRTRESPTKYENWGNWADNGIDVETSFSTSNSSPTSRRAITGLHNTRRETITLSKDGKSSASGSKDFPHVMTTGSSSDQMLEAIRGDCVMNATQHYKEGKDGRSEMDIKNSTYHAFEGVESSVGRKSPYSRMSESSRQVNDWNSSHEGHSRVSPAKQKDVLQDTSQRLTAEPDVKYPDKEIFGVRKFRFSSEAFEKRLQDKINRLRSPFTDDENRIFSEPRESPLKISEDSPQEGTPVGVLCNENRTSSPPSTKWPSFSTVQCQPLDRENHGPLNEDRYSDSDQCAAVHDFLPGQLDPVVEQKLDPLGSSIQNRKGIGAKDKTRAELEVMDDAPCQSLRSDTCKTYPTSVHHPQKLTEVSAKGFQHLDRGVPEVSNTEGALGDSQEEISDENAVLVSENALEGIQVEALEHKINSLQDLVGGLKESVESFTIRVEEDGEMWQGKVEAVMKDLKCLKDETQCELTGIKRSIEDEFKTRLDALTRDLEKTERLWTDTEPLRESSIGVMEIKIKECSAKVDLLKKNVNSLLSETKTTIVKEFKEKLSGTVKNVTDNLKTDLEVMRVGMSKELETIKQEMNSKLESIKGDTEKNRRTEKQLVETLVEEKICSNLSLLKETDTSSSLRAIEELKEELSMIWSDIQELVKGKEMVQVHFEQLAQNTEKAQENITKEHSVIKSESLSLKKQLQHFKKESLQNKIVNEDFRNEIRAGMDALKSNADFRNEIRAEIDTLKRAFGKLKEETQNIRTDFVSKNEIEDGLKMERDNLLKALERIDESEMNRKAELEALKQAQEELEKSQESSKCELTRERMLIMEKLENLSQIYLGGLEEVRSDLLIVKLNAQDRLGELEKQWEEYRENQASAASLSLRELVLDGLETRVAHLENNMESKKDERQNFEKDRLRVENLISVIEKDRKKVASAASESATSARKAGELLSEMQGSALETRRKSTKLQESLDLEREMVAAAISEARKLSADLDKEKEMAVSAISEARIKGLEICEGLQHERSSLEIILSEVQKERDIVAAATSQVEAAAVKAEETLTELTSIKRKSVHIHDNLGEVVNQAVMRVQDRCAREIERHIDDWRMSMSLEFSKAKSMTEELEEEKRKASILMIEASSSNSEPEESSTPLQERLQKTEEELEHLSRTIDDNRQEGMKTYLAIQEEMQNKLQKTDQELVTITRTVNELNEYKRQDRDAILKTQSDLTQLVQKFDTLDSAQKDIKDQFQRIPDNLRELGRRIEELSDRALMQQINSRLVRNEEGLEQIQRKFEDWNQFKHGNNQNGLKKLEDQLEKTDQELAHLSVTVDKLTGEKQQDDLKNDVREFHVKMEEVFETISHLSSAVEGSGEDSLAHNICHLENKMLETEKEQASLGQKISEVGRIVETLESRQMDLLHSVEEIKKNTGDIEKSTLELVPKYEVGAKIVSELESRVLILEESVRQGTGIHGEAIVQIDDRSSSAQQGLEITPTDSRVLNLENRIEHVESTTVTSLRILDAKMEHFSVGVQTALEGAAMAESKCGALGAELVKVFRMLASSRRESPLKMQEGDDNNESGSRADNRKQQQQQRPDNSAGIKLKAPMSLAACSYCKKPNPKGGECGCRNKEAKDGNVRLGQPEIPPTDSKQMQDPRPDGSSRIRLKHSIEPHREHGSSEMRAVEAGKQPIVMDKFDSAKEGGKNSQMGTFKLESGKPQMNSSHRSSPGPNPRLPKRGDTL